MMRSKKKSKRFWKQMKMNTQQSKIMWHRKGSPERVVHSNTGLLKKIETFQINNRTLPLQEIKEQQRQPRARRRKEINKIRAELNEIETKHNSKDQ